MTELEHIAKMLKAKRDAEIQAAVNRVLTDVEKSGTIPADLTERIAREIEKIFDSPHRLDR